MRSRTDNPGPEGMWGQIAPEGPEGGGRVLAPPRRSHGEGAAVSAAGVECGHHCFVAEGTGLETDGVPTADGACSDCSTRKYSPKAPSS
jgi:hypothetical protein